MFAEVIETTDDYRYVYEQVGTRLERAVHEDSTNRTNIVELMRYHVSGPGNEQSNFKECVHDMEKEQNNTYYIAGKTIASVSSSPFLKELKPDFEPLTGASSSKHECHEQATKFSLSEFLLIFTSLWLSLWILPFHQPARFGDCFVMVWTFVFVYLPIQFTKILLVPCICLVPLE